MADDEEPQTLREKVSARERAERKARERVVERTGAPMEVVEILHEVHGCGCCSTVEPAEAVRRLQQIYQEDDDAG